MWKRIVPVVGVLAALGFWVHVHSAPPAPPAAPAAAPAGTPDTPVKAADPTLPKIAPNKVIGVTVYPSNALITREVSVPEGAGSFELVVSPLPPMTVNSSLYSEGSDGIRILTTRYRMRPIKEDTRDEVRKLEAQLKQVQNDNVKLQSEAKVIDQNQLTLTKLEAFTGSTMQHMTDKGQLNGDAVIALSKYIMDGRGTRADDLVANQQKQQDNMEQIQFLQRKMQELSAGSSKTEHDAVIVVEKKDAGAGKVRLNYLVDAASWRPQYKFRAGGKDKDPITVEYLAAINQQTGEDWGNVNLTLSTAEPRLNAAPPELRKLEVAVARANVPPAQAAGQVGMPGGGFANAPGEQLEKQARDLRKKAQENYTSNNPDVGGKLVNDAAAWEQQKDLLATREEDLKNKAKGWRASTTEGPSVTYHLPTKLTVPSRPDEQVLEVAKIEMAPDYYYKAVPVLTSHVYRLANLINKSEYILLPGEATMYLGTDFVGRANLPLVAIGEQFTAGFGVDPQLQVQRQMIDKVKSTQGDNQVLKFEYRILVSSYKPEAVKVQVWDRLPHAESDVVGVNLVKTEPKISTDGLYLREERPQNLLRWDMNVEPTMNGEKAVPINYEFKLEMGRQMQIGNFAVR